MKLGESLGKKHKWNIQKEKEEMMGRLREEQAQELQRQAKERQAIMDRRTCAIVGDASETALMRYSDRLVDIDMFRQHHPKVFEIPFNSKNKWQLSIHQDGEHWICVLKGAPEIVLVKCSEYIHNGYI